MDARGLENWCLTHLQVVRLVENVWFPSQGNRLGPHLDTPLPLSSLKLVPGGQAIIGIQDDILSLWPILTGVSSMRLSETPISTFIMPLEGVSRGFGPFILNEVFATSETAILVSLQTDPGYGVE